MIIREFRVDDEMALHAVYLSAIHEIAINDYTLEQINAWAPHSINTDLWANRMRGISPFVVEAEGKAVAYADLQPNGYIDHFFVSRPVARKGVGTALMNYIHEVADAKKIEALSSNVSRTAQPFFRRFGFVIIEQRSPKIRGVIVPNAFMNKTL
jgi:putative acetyltransferase